ncbi:hypothetical protein LZC95_28700 [Pendulispora brunnea]|uniref:Uncharacterized protein n=1 Tax=Pendulispora brunnea TaxID=2905690 RepID=A0ABZ2JVN0_9BACT
MTKLAVPATIDDCTVALASGRSLEVRRPSGDHEILRVLGSSGRIELTVVLTDAGPKLIFEAADIELRATHAVSVACERFDVHASQEARIEAHHATIETTAGDIALRANDNVVVVGEQIRLNCDKPDEVPPWMKETLGARLPGPSDLLPSIPASDITGDAEVVAKFDDSPRATSESSDS